MAPRLGEILIQDGNCRAETVQQALQHQAVFGGRLGTNLLELGAVSEETLAFALGKRTGAPALYGDLPADPKAIRLLDRRLAERWDVVPFLLADRRLAVLARDPCDLQMLDEVAFATGKNVHAFVVPEARLWRTLQRAYGIDREHRGLDMGRRAMTPPPMQAVRLDEAQGTDDLIDEDDFRGLYGSMAGMGPNQTPAPGQLPAATPPPGTLQAWAPQSGEPIPVPLSTPPSLQTPAATPTPVPADLPPLTLEVLEELTVHPGHQPPPALELPAILQSRPAGSDGEPSPLTFAEAVRFLEGVDERSTIARTVLRYARSRFERAVLLTVQRGEVHGWAGLGGGLTAEAVHRLRLPLGVPGVVDTVVTTRAPFIGPLPKTWSNIRLLKGLGGGVPRSALLVPVVALGRVVNVLYADAGKGRLVDASDLGELLILSTRIAKSYEDLARRAV